MHPKVVRDKMVAVLYSPGFGAGWFSWNESIPACLFDPEIVDLVERGTNPEDIEALAQKKWPDGYWGGARDLAVEWLSEDALFRIEEYDGSERIITRETQGWVRA
jgi:hypothetical protein